MSSAAEKIAPQPEPPSLSLNIEEQAAAALNARRIEQLGNMMRGGVASREVIINDLWLTAFPVVNAVVFLLLLRSPYYAAVSEGLERCFAVGFSLLILPCLLLAQRSVFLEARLEVRARRPAGATALALALASAALLLLSSVLFDRELLVSHKLYIAIPLLHFGAALLRWSERGLFHRLDALTCYPSPSFSAATEILSGESGVTETRGIPRVGDVIKLRPGQNVPADVTVLNGVAVVEECRISPLSSLRIKECGEVIPGGSTLLSGVIDARVEGAPEDSHLSGLVLHLRRRLQRYWDIIEDRIDRDVTLFSGLVFALAFGSAIYWFASGASMLTIVTSFVSVLCVVPMVRAWALGFLAAPIGETLLFKQGFAVAEGLVFERMSALHGLVLECTPRSPIGEMRVRSVEILDPRVSAESLDSLLCSVLGRFDDPVYSAVVDDVRRRRGGVGVVSVKNLVNYPGQGVSGEFEKSEISIGQETFLLARGVLLQESDIVSGAPDDTVIYVAIGDGIVARVRLAPPFTLDARDLIADLRSLGVKSILTARADGSLDEMGKAIGLELSQIYVFSDDEKYRQKLADWPGMAMLVTRDTSAELREVRRPTIGVFDELRWDLRDADVMLMAPRLSSLPSLFVVPRRVRRVVSQNVAILWVLGTLLLIVSVLALVPPWIVLSLVFAATVLANLNLLRVARL